MAILHLLKSFPVIVFAVIFFSPLCNTDVFADTATPVGDSVLFTGDGDSTNASTRFSTLQFKFKGFAKILLLLMVVVAAIMAAFQKVQYAINVALAAVILFGGAYLIELVSVGLSNTP